MDDGFPSITVSGGPPSTTAVKGSIRSIEVYQN